MPTKPRTTHQRIRAKLKGLRVELADLLERESQGTITDAVERADLESKIWTCVSELQKDGSPEAVKAAQMAARFSETAAKLGRAEAYDRVRKLEAERDQQMHRQAKLRAL